MSKKRIPKIARRTQQKPPRSLPLALIAVGVVVLGGALLAALAARPPADSVPVEVTGAPRLKVDRLSENLGDIPLGRTVEVSFQVANVGDQPLRFSEAPYITVAEGC